MIQTESKHIVLLFLGSGQIEYRILSGDPDGLFRIDSGSGQISTNSALDYEKVNSVLLNVQAQTRSGSNPPTYGQAQVSTTIINSSRAI